MAIEAINNAMGVNATGYVAPAKTQVAPLENVELDTGNIDASVKIDDTTAVVQNADAKEGADYDGSSESGKNAASNEQLKKALQQFTKKMGNSEAVYGIHEETGRVTIKLVDKDTKKVIKELPPEKTLDMIARVWEMAGILVDEKR